MSSRKALQTLQMTPELEQNQVAKSESKANAGDASCESESKLPSRFPSSECKDNADAKSRNESHDYLKNKTSASCSYESVKVTVPEKSSEGYWKELAERLHAALKTPFRENEDLHEAKDTLRAEIESLNRKDEVQNNILSFQKDKLELQAKEIRRLRELTAEVEEMRGYLEEFTRDIDDFDWK